MSEDSGQVTLIFYKLSREWWNEPFLNIVAAAAQFSSFTHVELAIGTDATTAGAMCNVCRIFNDNTGVVYVRKDSNPTCFVNANKMFRFEHVCARVCAQELAARTGRNPQCVS